MASKPCSTFNLGFRSCSQSGFGIHCGIRLDRSETLFTDRISKTKLRCHTCVVIGTGAGETVPRRAIDVDLIALVSRHPS
jgi:hypothetical protein